MDLFQPISQKWRLFRRTGLVQQELLEIPIATSADCHADLSHPERKPSRAIGFNELMQKVVLAGLAPAYALINRNFELLNVIGPLVRYLEFPPGDPTRDIIAMARDGLRAKVRAAVHKAAREHETIVDDHARVKRDGTYFPCKITVKPLAEPKEAKGLLLVAFEDRI